MAKIPKIFRLGGGRNNITAPQQNQGGVQNNAERFEKLRNQDWFRMLASAFLESVVYFIILAFMPDFSEAWQKHGATLLLSVIFFAFVGFAQKKPGTLADSILTFLAFIFLFQMAINYLG